MITAEQLQPYIDKGVAAAAKALRRDTRTINRAARSLGIRFATPTELNNAERREWRARMAPKVRAMARKRMRQREMCEALGISRNTLRTIAREHNININSFSLY